MEKSCRLFKAVDLPVHILQLHPEDNILNGMWIFPVYFNCIAVTLYRHVAGRRKALS